MDLRPEKEHAVLCVTTINNTNSFTGPWTQDPLLSDFTNFTANPEKEIT
jgi:hypothetical protein